MFWVGKLLTFKYIAAANDEENISSYNVIKKKNYSKHKRIVKTWNWNRMRSKTNRGNRNSQGFELFSVLTPRLPRIISDKHQLLPLTMKLRININIEAFNFKKMEEKNSGTCNMEWLNPHFNSVNCKTQAIQSSNLRNIKLVP